MTSDEPHIGPVTTVCMGCGKPSRTAYCDSCAPPDPANFLIAHRHEQRGYCERLPIGRWKTKKVREQ